MNALTQSTEPRLARRAVGAMLALALVLGASSAGAQVDTSTPATVATTATVAAATAATTATAATDVATTAAVGAISASDIATSVVVREYDGNGLRMNFKDVPLQTVLDYLSEAAGFIVVLRTKIDARVDVQSQQPLTNEEAINLLNTVLYFKGYAAVRNERTLTIVDLDDAAQYDLKVFKEREIEEIPKTDEIVTQIIPIRHLDAMKLIANLDPLLPKSAVMTGNQSSNSLLLTDTQTNIRRMMEVIKALDTSISNISAVQVFPLRHADATELAKVVTQIFLVPTSSGGSGRGGRGGGDPREMFMQQMRGGGNGGGASAGGPSEARQASSRVVAVADERTNSLVVSAPGEMMDTIEKLVKEVDMIKEDITEIRVFRLIYSDAEEMAALVTDMFDEESQSRRQSGRQSGGTSFRGPMGFIGRGGDSGRSQSANSSERKLQEQRVSAKPDLRTNSVIVSAASETMSLIVKMIEELDKNPAKNREVHVHTLENAGVEEVAAILEAMFAGQTGGRSTRTNTSRNTQTNQGFNLQRGSNTGSTRGSGGSSGGSSR